jgi:transcriptional regulator with XRE-family HTH domain
MESVLEKNIRALLKANNLSLADLSRSSGVPYRTLQDILARKQATKVTTLAAIAKGLGVTPGRLLENPVPMAEHKEPSKEQLLISVFKEALKLNDIQLASVLKDIEARLNGGLDEDGFNGTDEIANGD